MTASRIRVPLVVLALVILHVTVVARVVAAGVRPDILLLFAVAAGLTGGPERGAAAGFVVGLAADLFVETPLGLSSLTFSVAGFAVGVVQGNILRATWWITPVTAFVASSAAVLLYAVLGAMMGRTTFTRPEVALIVLVVAAVNAALAVPMVRVTAWAFAGGRPERSYV